MILSNKRITKALIRLRECAGWSASVLFANPRRQVFLRRGPFAVLALSCLKVQRKAKIRNRYNQAPLLTRNTIWESDKNTRKHHTQESQEVSPFPAGAHKAARDKHTKPQPSHHNKETHET